ncbi:phosphoribosylglycinamide formyltransferase [Helicobacter sp. UBA3407]|uniref:phosphoribosylglycinamide formyltransferase n=1 Tax=Helicobacter TaxID=209 RepID=UPI00262F2051|nr:phosphoribosylglycinamide formyltransferase [Helicobacter sp. UBA3407]
METKRIAILFSGNGSNLEALIKSLHKKCFLPSKRPENIKQSTIGGFLIGDVLIEGFLIGGLAHTFKIIEPDCAKGKHSNKAFKVEVVLALSNKSDAFGLTRAKRLGIATEVIENAGKTREEFDAQLITTLQEFKLDLCVLAGFMRILTPIFTQKIRAINIHPSLLPLFKGAHGILESYNSPMRLGGVSVHYVSEELDSGEIIAQGAITKISGESLESYEARIHKLEHTLYPLALLEALTRKK